MELKIKETMMKEIQAKEATMYAEKNQRYGDSFHKIYQEHGPLSLVLRLEDKLSRLKSILLDGTEAGDESAIDTLMDMANYSNMGIIELMGAPTIEPKAKKAKKDRKCKKGMDPEASSDETPTAPMDESKPKKSKKTKNTTPDKNETTKEEGPLDSLTKEQLKTIIAELGGETPRKANREKLYEILNELPKAKVAVAVTSIKKANTPMEEKVDGK